VRPFPDVTSGRWQASTGGGQDPKWAPDGRFVFIQAVAPDSDEPERESGDIVVVQNWL